MPIGFLGYAEIEGYHLLTNSTGLNRQVNPLQSTGVWGAGWYNAATTTNYADSQQHFEGGISFELQAQSGVWNVFRDWCVEQRVYPKSARISPNGIVRYDYLASDDPRNGLWLSQASFTIAHDQLIGVQATGVALRREEVVVGGGNYRDLRDQGFRPTAPLNPAPFNRNPIAGWIAAAEITWPNSAPFWSESNLTGLVLMNASVNLNNNTQIIRGCVHGDTRVWTENGYLKIKSLSDTRQALLTEFGSRRVDGIVAQGKKKILRVRTKLGNDIKVSVDHRFRVLNSDGTLGWKRAVDLRKGDFLLGQRGSQGMLPENRGKDPNYWYAVGHLYGDGCQRKREMSWLVVEGQEELLIPLKSYFETNGLTYGTSIRSPSQHGGVNRTKSCYWLHLYKGRDHFSDIPQPQSKGKWRMAGVPEALWTSGRQQICAFLRGLFTTDGATDRGVVSFTTKYRKIAKDVKSLLSMVGILSGIQYRARRNPFGGILREYEVVLAGVRSREIFFSEIGFVDSVKSERAQAWRDRQTKRSGDHLVVIPYMDRLIQNLCPTWNFGYNGDRSAIETLRTLWKGKIDSLSESMSVRVQEVLKTRGKTCQLLELYTQLGWYFDPVEKVDEFGEAEVYDPHNSETSSYVAGGLVHHNCTGDVNPVAVLQGTITVDGNMTVWRDGPIEDPYGDNSTPSGFTASNASVVFTLGGGVGELSFRMNNILLTSDSHDVQGANTPTTRNFGIAGMGDGINPPLLFDLAV